MIRPGAGFTPLALAIACAATMAQATPPDMIHIRDDLFGVSADAVFVLRSSHDNLGLHGADFRNIALVAIDRTTAEERIWPVWRGRNTIESEGTVDSAMLLVEYPELASAIDPFAKLREFGGYPTFGSTPFALLDISHAPNIGSNDEAIWGFTLQDGTHFEPDPQALAHSIGPSLDQFVEAMGDYPRFGPLTAGDLLIGWDPAGMGCRFLDRAMLDNDPAVPPVHLMRVTCPAEGVDADADVTVSLLRLIPPSPAP